jgi:protein-disulfide isomerase
MPIWKRVLDVVTSVTMIIAALVVVWFQINPRTADDPIATLQLPAAPLSIKGDTIKGSRDADTVLIVYSDFECPFCKRFAQDVLPQLHNDYVAKGKLAVVFRHFPLRSHRHARDAAVAAECAGRQGRFWEMHDRMFEAPTLDVNTITTLALSLNLMPKFTECTRSVDVAELVTAQASLASSLGVQGTPSFFLGKRTSNDGVKVERAFSGARPIGDFREALDSLD